VWHISELTCQLGSSDNFTTYISERLYITNLKEVSWSSNKVKYTRELLKYNDWCPSFDYMEQRLSSLVLQLLAWRWLCKWFRPTLWYRYKVKYMLRPSVESPNNLRWARYVPRNTAGMSFKRNACLQSVQKYQINFTQRCITRFQNSHLWTAFLHSNWWGLGTWSL
jgi:hypothetical protein